MAYPDVWIYQFATEGIMRVSYEETEHFQAMRSSLANPERMLHTPPGGEQ
jgi:predicted ATPase